MPWGQFCKCTGIRKPQLYSSVRQRSVYTRHFPKREAGIINVVGLTRPHGCTHHHYVDPSEVWNSPSCVHKTTFIDKEYCSTSAENLNRREEESSGDTLREISILWIIHLSRKSGKWDYSVATYQHTTKIMYFLVRFEIFTAVAIKNEVLWNVKPCGSWNC